MPFANEITQIALELYPKIFQDTSTLKISESERIKIGDNCAATMCHAWQTEALKISHHEIVAEANVAGNNPIDLLDLTDGVAYELKYSYKNVKQEFYKDLFKVLIYNEQVKAENRLQTFVFLCHFKGITSLLSSSLCLATMQFMAKNGVTVELVELFPEENSASQAA